MIPRLARCRYCFVIVVDTCFAFVIASVFVKDIVLNFSGRLAITFDIASGIAVIVV